MINHSNFTLVPILEKQIANASRTTWQSKQQRAPIGQLCFDNVARVFSSVHTPKEFSYTHLLRRTLIY